MEITTVTHVYHVDIDIDQCNSNTDSNRSHNMLWMICSTFAALNLPP